MNMVFYPFYLQGIIVAYIALLGPSSADFVQIQGNPQMFNPGLTKTMTLRCSIHRDQPPQNSEQTDLSRHVSPNIAIDNVVSMLISRIRDGESEPETVAESSPFYPAKAKLDLDIMKIEGAIELEGSNAKELGYLQLTWDYPLEEQSGIYVCDVNVLNSDLHMQIVSVAMNMIQRNPTTEDLSLNFIQLKRDLRMFKNKTRIQLNKADEKIAELEKVTQKLIGLVGDGRGQMIQKGQLVCNFIGLKTITFPQAYDKPPEVVIGVSYLYVDESNDYGSDIKPSVSNLKTTGFKIKCDQIRCVTCKIVWIAFRK